MKASDLRPASDFAQRFGVKALAYGKPRTGKTRAIITAPRPILCLCEPGATSLRDADHVPTWEAYTQPKIHEFYKFITESAEAKNYDTVCIDSLSQLAETVLDVQKAQHSHGLKAYGAMSDYVMEICKKLYFLPQKHLYLVAKQAVVEEGGIMFKRPYFPGKDLNIQIPHLFDQILYVGEATIPGVGSTVAFHSRGSPTMMAGDRFGKLAEFEPLNLSYLFAKCMA